MSTALARPQQHTEAGPADPATMGWPPTLPLELAMRVAPVRELCEAHGLDRQQWDELRHNEDFIAAVADARDALKKDGMSFKMKARLQAEELLKTSWSMIHAPSIEVPANVKADLLKFTIKAAGLDGSRDQAAGIANGSGLQINIDLSGH